MLQQIRAFRVGTMWHRGTRAALAMCALVIYVTAARAVANPDQLRQQFASPPKSARPLIRWWLPGGDIDDATLVRQIEAFDQAGFGGAELQSLNVRLGKLSPDQLARVNDYATPEYFRHVAAAARAAQSRGLFIDFTFGSGWPAGGGWAITPELAAVEIAVGHQTVMGPGRFSGKIPLPEPPDQASSPEAPQPLPEEWQKRLKERVKIIAVVAIKGGAPVEEVARDIVGRPIATEVSRAGQLEAGTELVLTDRVRADGTLDWVVPEGQWQLLVFRQFPTGQPVTGGVGEGPQLVLDHFSRAAFDAHARRVGDSGEPILAPLAGQGLRAIFVDSFELRTRGYWTEGFLSEFKRRRGYELTPYLALILQPGWMDTFKPLSSHPFYEMPGVSERILADYRLTLSELMQENFFQPLAAWGRRNNLLTRVQTYGSPSEFIESYGAISIPETEDLYAGPASGFLRFARAGADIYGKTLVSSESYIIAGETFGVTPLMLKARADELFVNGINEIIAHGSPYPYAEDGGTGWFPWRGLFSSMLNQHNPIWPYLSPVTAYIARAQAILQSTRNVVPVAVYWEQLGYHALPPGKTAAEPPMNSRLREAGYDYDWLNADGLLRSRVIGRELVTPGGFHYRALVLPEVGAMRLEQARRLREFVDDGLPVIFAGKRPDRDEGFKEYPTRDEDVQRAVKAAQEAGARLVPVASVQDALRELGVKPNLRFLDGTQVPFIQKQDGEREFYFLSNPDATARHVTLEVEGHRSAELWDALDGSMRPQPVVVAGDSERVTLDLAPHGSAFVVFASDVPSVPPVSRSAHEAKPTKMLLGAHGWGFRAEGYGLKARPISVERRLPELQDWRHIAGLEDLAGHAAYRVRFEIGPRMLSGNRRLLLDLGEIHDAAAIHLNGCPAMIVAIPPFVADVTDFLRVGDNELQIDVANTPYNAMLGTTAMPGFAVPWIPTATEPRPAGLLGPVSLKEFRMDHKDPLRTRGSRCDAGKRAVSGE